MPGYGPDGAFYTLPRDLIRWCGYTDLGSNHALKFVSFNPDISLNPQYEPIRSMLPILRFGALVPHLNPKGGACGGAVHFNTAAVRAVDAISAAHCKQLGIPYAGDYPRWDVVKWAPFTLSPSLLCDPQKGGCGDHGHIIDGRWKGC